ncbi:MAG: N-acetyltransferase [Ruminococcaceae bacterium]|jgi:GNAT superfamily N-acetyltransferase|nr:N-acetyltransferase [Oscillospiraceae bacterium]
MPKTSGVKMVVDPAEKESMCREALGDFPEKLERENGIEDIVAQCRLMPVWADLDGDAVRGVAALRETSPCAAEVFIIAVRKEFQRHKIGKALFTALLNYARRQGYEYLQVKTLRTGVCPEYDSANVFYQSLGFRELEVLPIWGEENPCQILIRNVN